MSSLNRAALEVLILLKLRKRLNQSELILLQGEIEQSSELAQVEKSMIQGLDYIQKLSHLKINEAELPSYPQKEQWAEQIATWFTLSKRWVLPIFLLISLFGLKFYLDQAGYINESDTLVQQPMSSHRVVTLASGVLPGITKKSDLKPRVIAQVEKPINDKVETKKISNLDKEIDLKQARNINSVVELQDSSASGYVIRAEVKTNNLDDVTQSFLSDLNKLSPKKAGEVDLGWEKSKNIRYFHFTVATQHEFLIKNLMLKLGKIKWSKDPHPRKMPKDTIRFIIQIIESES